MAGVVIIGAGPGIGRAVALRFAREGRPLALISRSAGSESLVPEEFSAHSYVADCTDEDALRAALDAAVEDLGLPEVIVYNAALIRPDAPGELSMRDQLDAWAVNVLGALTAAAHLLPGMTQGSFLITGGMPEPKPEYVSLSLGKAGVRTLVELLSLRYPGIHVASVTIDGPVAPGTDFDPGLIAEHFWTLHAQPRGEWAREIVHRGART
ncbi:SDR family NAD(P)-dependent oxidoreductase [Amycolatopsis sp.]|uniref:SDR family NAD(P)-dependent oxidoreductase n=1 Tax=Amycolatopsis sp. TaxID=37632 RepID=UPI002BA2F51E|nr:SDR family NAD(P)-dependent oxidoreductase [Amycolatopsis sp.]HVV13634.1 SDR family NAD(P)-dependent oxidoreductase [Amycolatopsis sp.]